MIAPPRGEPLREQDAAESTGWCLGSGPEEEEGLFILTETHCVDLTVKKGQTPWPPDMRQSTATDAIFAAAFKG